MQDQEYTTRLSIYRHRIKAVEGIVEEWKKDHKDAMRVMTLEEIFQQIVDLAKFLEKGIKEITDGFLSEDKERPGYNSRRKLAEMASELLVIFEDTISEADRFAKMGYSVNYLDEMKNTTIAFNSAVEFLKKTCPAPNQDMLFSTALNIKRGQVRPASELLDEAKSKYDSAG
jgi:mannose/fructose/N-acetylgalactosamine-specific phosphotransferase system component IIB